MLYLIIVWRRIYIVYAAFFQIVALRADLESKGKELDNMKGIRANGV